MRVSHATVLCLALAVATLGAAPGDSPTIRESKFELFVTDVEESARFYITLGFVIEHQKPDGYATLRNGSTIVALSAVPSWLPLRWLGFLRRPPIGTEIVFYATRLEDLRSALDDAGYEPGEITLQSWGDRDFRVTDYEGYYIRVSEGHAVPRAD